MAQRNPQWELPESRPGKTVGYPAVPMWHPMFCRQVNQAIKLQGVCRKQSSGMAGSQALLRSQTAVSHLCWPVGSLASSTARMCHEPPGIQWLSAGPVNSLGIIVRRSPRRACWVAGAAEQGCSVYLCGHDQRQLSVLQRALP